MPIMTYGGFKRMTGFCKTKVPQDLSDKIESLKDNEEALKARGAAPYQGGPCNDMYQLTFLQPLCQLEILI